MGMIALRGLPGDYEDWARRGATGWGWDEVLPYFRGMTRDLDRPAAGAQRARAEHRAAPAARDLAALHEAGRGGAEGAAAGIASERL